MIEVVSPGSEERDYQQKREEYLLFGAREYWIFDAEKEEMLVLRRSGGRWIERALWTPKYTKRGSCLALNSIVARFFEPART